MIYILGWLLAMVVAYRLWVGLSRHSFNRFEDAPVESPTIGAPPVPHTSVPQR